MSSNTDKWHRLQRRLWKWCHRVLEAWASLHVEFQGYYSKQRLQQLQAYSDSLSTARLVFVCLVTPLPCLCMSLLVEAVPLPPPEAGISRNWFVFVRSWALIVLIGAGELVQIGEGVPKLKLRASQVAFVSICAATFAISFVVLVCSLTVFPLPFGLLVAAPPTVLALGACFIYISRLRLRAETSLWSELKRQLNVFHCEVALTIVYPLYIYGYISLSGFSQACFVLLSPAIQITAKNFVSRSLTDHNEMKLVTIIFFVEIFNALYSSSVLQGTSTWYAITLIMGTDILQFGLAMFDTTKLLNEVRVLMKKIPRGHPVAQENFVQIAERLMNVESEVKPQPKARTRARSVALGQDRILSWMKLSNVLSSPSRVATLRYSSGLTGRDKYILFRQARIFPISPPQRNDGEKRNFQTNRATDVAAREASADKTPALGIEAIFSQAERRRFIKKTSQVLFVTEFVMLVEYIEVAMPTILGIHQLVLFHMPNSIYYPQLANLSSTQFYMKFSNVMAYASLELLSLMLATVVLNRTVGFSGLPQLAFVLEKQAVLIQMKLMGVFIYVMQVTLKHVGADFSFKFAWVHSAKTD